MQSGTLLCFLGLLSLGESGWVGVLPISTTAEDVGLWPCSVGVLVEMAAFF